MKSLHAIDRIDPAATATSSATAYPESAASESPSSATAPAAADAMLLARKSLLSAPDVQTLQTAAASHLRRHAGAALVAWYYPSSGQIGQTDRIDGLLCPTEGIAESLRLVMNETAHLASQSSDPCLRPMPGASEAEFYLVALPIPAFSGQCLLALLEPHSQHEGLSSESWASLLMLSGLMNEWALQRHCITA
ncbi:MAG: hypothetical protein WKF77_30750, partial [Planctomycetaceae bacterium]